MPQSLTSRQMGATILLDVQDYGIITVPNGSVLTLTTTTRNRLDPEKLLRVGVQPFQAAFYEDNYSEDYRIPISSNVAFTDYSIIGPLHEPQIRVKTTSGIVLIDIGDEYKVITKTYLRNNSGAPHNIIYFTGARTFSQEFASTGTPRTTT
jgi:hypothetical protein